MDATASAAPTAPALDVSALPDPALLLRDLAEDLAAWMPAQRWFAHKATGDGGPPPQVAVVGWATLRVRADHLVLWTALRVTTRSEDALYQVPLLLRAADEAHGPEDPAAVIARREVPGAVPAPGHLLVTDALRERAGRDAVLDALAEGGGAVGPGLRLALAGPADASVLPRGAGRSSRVLSGEQSNTSVIYEADGAVPVIVKVFRVLQDGLNPDVELQGGLSAAGSTRVPPVVGAGLLALAGVRTHALFAQEFLPGVEDAWRTALRAAADDPSGTGDAGSGLEEIRALGVAVAEVHADLAAARGTLPADAPVVADLLGRMRARAQDVAAAVPAVREHLPVIEGLLADAAEVPWPAMQRIHGDLHLGQVLSVPDRGWVLLDFEGEPLRDLAERSLPDSPLRDVAGMLRSLDYVHGALRTEQGVDARAWSERAREAFRDGYAHGIGRPSDDPALAVLLAAFEADKAVYEALYESRNRPDWLPIPLAALDRISADRISADRISADRISAEGAPEASAD